MREIFMSSILLMASFDDLKRSKISNSIVIPAIFAALTYRLYAGGFIYAIRGVSVMFSVCLLFSPVFKLRGIGAGDIKIFCVIAGFYGLILGLKVAALTIVLAGITAFYRVWKNPVLLGRFLELKNYLLYGINGGEKYFIAEKSEDTAIIHMAPFTAISYFLNLLLKEF